jgi:hypothetical protein
MKTITGALLILCLLSCKTTRNVQKFAKQVDSTGFFKRDSSRVLRVDSVSVEKDKTVHVEQQQNDYEEWIWIEEDSVKKKTIIHKRDKGVVSSKVVTISKDSTSLKKSDSATAHVTHAAVVHSLDEGKNLNVKKTQGGLWINLGIMLFILLCLYLGYRKYKSKFLPIVLLITCTSCITPESTIALRDALPHVVPAHDTICIEESYDWFRHREPIHIHCKHDKP